MRPCQDRLGMPFPALVLLELFDSLNLNTKPNYKPNPNPSLIPSPNTKQVSLFLQHLSDLENS